VIKGIHTRYTNEAADRLRQFEKPTLGSPRSWREHGAFSEQHHVANSGAFSRL
jgi:hypothetical protein